MKITEARKRATEKYISGRINSGWSWMTILVPKSIKQQLMDIKHKLMKEYYAKKSNN